MALANIIHGAAGEEHGMERPDWAPEGIDIERPSAARIYDYVLGGSHNFAIDREMARNAMLAIPNIAEIAQVNRAFLRRAVRYLVDAGIRQFLDIGSGIPTLGNVHEIAQRLASEARVMYVDIDPVAVAHSRMMLAGNDRARVIQEDLRQPERILAHPDVRGLLDFGQPIGVLLVAVLPFVPDEDDPVGVMATLRAGLPPGSYVALAHRTQDGFTEEAVARGREMFARTATPVTMRDRAHIERLCAGLDLVEPGLVWATQWHPEDPDDVAEHPERSGNYVAVGRVS
jgi:hypothetical protein